MKLLSEIETLPEGSICQRIGRFSDGWCISYLFKFNYDHERCFLIQKGRTISKYRDRMIFVEVQ